VIFYVFYLRPLFFPPLLDIKPYVPEFDIKRAGQIGWLSKRAEKECKMKADGRFAGVE